ncbi:hypothetical protein ACXIVK_18975 [Paraburkholderia caledonica]
MSETMKEDPITQLSDIVDALRVPLPYDAAAVKKWQSCPLTEYRERHTVKPLPQEHYGLLSDAMNQWNEREQRVLHLFDGSSEKFDAWFTLARESLSQGRPVFGKSWYELEQEELTYAAEASRMVVRNVGLAKSFGVYLPLCVPQSRTECATMGARMAAIFFLECVAKMRDMSELARMHDMPYIGPKGLAVDFSDSGIQTANAIWLRARELQSGE